MPDLVGELVGPRVVQVPRAAASRRARAPARRCRSAAPRRGRGRAAAGSRTRSRPRQLLPSVWSASPVFGPAGNGRVPVRGRKPRDCTLEAADRPALSGPLPTAVPSAHAKARDVARRHARDRRAAPLPSSGAAGRSGPLRPMRRWLIRRASSAGSSRRRARRTAAGGRAGGDGGRATGRGARRGSRGARRDAIPRRGA